MFNVDEVVAEDNERANEQRALQVSQRKAVEAILNALPTEARRALARRAGDTIHYSNDPVMFFVYPLRAYTSPLSWVWWRYDTYGRDLETRESVAFDPNGKLVKVVACEDDEQNGIEFVSSEISVEDAARLIPYSDGYDERLAQRIADGLVKTLAAIKERRQRISELLAVSEKIKEALQ
jgi:hypothetical protein